MPLRAKVVYEWYSVENKLMSIETNAVNHIPREKETVSLIYRSVHLGLANPRNIMVIGPVEWVHWEHDINGAQTIRLSLHPVKIEEAKEQP
jgi:hypothetical protein